MDESKESMIVIDYLILKVHNSDYNGWIRTLNTYAHTIIIS
jgi:hypothetical protein